MHRPFSLFSTLVFMPLLSAQDTIPLRLAPFPVEAEASDEMALSVPGPEIHLQRPADLAEMLSNSAPGVQLVRKGGASNDLRLNGMGEEDVTILQDGQRIYCACPNRMDPPASHTETTAIAQIEVVSGAFDLTHAGSLGGTISVQTRDPRPGLHSELDYALGSFAFQRYGFALEGGSEQLSALLSASYSQSQPYEDGDGTSLTHMPTTSAWPLDDFLPEVQDDLAYREARASAKVLWQPGKDARHVLHLGYRHATDILYPALRMDADLNDSVSLASESEITLNHPLADTLSWNLYYNTTQHDMSDRRRLSSIYGMSMSDRPTYVLDRGYYMQSLAESSTTGLHLQLKKTVQQVIWRSGIEAILRDWKIDNRLGAGTATADPSMEIFNNMIPDTRSLVLGSFLEADWQLSDRWTLASGLRIDRYALEARADAPTLEATYGAFDPSTEDCVVSAKLMARHHLMENSFLFFGVGHTARPLNGKELYMNLARPGMMPNWVGNPELDTPRMTELAAGTGWNSDRITLYGRVFYRFLENYVYPVADATGSKPLQTYTGLNAHLLGLEGSAHWRIDEHWESTLGFAWQEGRKDSYPSANADPHLAEIPGASLRATLTYRAQTWFVGAELHHRARHDAVDEIVGEFALSSSTVLHLRAGIDLPKPIGGTLLIGVENVFDRNYSLHNAYVRDPFGSGALITEPGRWGCPNRC